MKLKDIRRTATFAWSPSTSERNPLLATGTVAGALDESFSNESQLEIWDLDFMEDEFELGGEGQEGPRAYVNDSARYNRLAWGSVNNTTEKGVIAAGLENGELALWNPAKILAGADPTESLILRNTIHTGPVRGLDFNPLAQNLLASGGVAGEVYIWDLKDPSKPYTPTSGTRSQKLDEMTSVAWNQKVQYVLAGASSTGYTVVWDLRGKREVASLAYGGGAGTLAGANALGGGMAAGGRRGMSDIAWHPDNATRLVTSSEDDSSPVIMVWDLRNARAPEKILSGHEKGILSLSWCKHDADLLLSCGKDNRTLCWNPQTSEIIGELPPASNWAFQVDWCPRNPDILATAFFDGTIGIHSAQTTNEAVSNKPPVSAKPDGSDVWGQPIHQPSGGTFSLKQTPKWLRRPVSSTFGFGGKLVSVSNLPDAQGQHQSSSVHVRSVVTEQDFVERAKDLESAISGQNVQEFAEKKVEDTPSNDAWKALLSLFKANSREELVTLLGFSKAEIAARVAEAVDNLKASATRASAEQEEDITETEVPTDRIHEPVVSFAEPEKEKHEAASDSETAGGSSIASSARADAESTTTVPSLFGEDDGPGTPQIDAGQDFFNTVGIQQDNGESLPVHVPHTNYPVDSSVAATMGSRPSSAASAGALSLKENSFKIYPANESDTDRLVTKALVLGDFESAVQLCLSSERYADAILLAVRGGPALLAKTQKAYFEKRTTELPYLRLFQSIVTNDLADIVQNADLKEWQEIFVVICTFASQEEFAGLAEQLGMRLEFQGGLVAKDEDSDSDEEDEEDSDEEDSDEEDGAVAKSNPYRKNATLTYLAAAKLERLINIWGEDLVEEEKTLLAQGGEDGGSYFSIHANALLSFVEKVSIFRSATSYKDEDLNAAASSDSNAAIKTYKLAGLYDRYLEYAELLSTQGLLKEAASVLNLIPASYKGSSPHLDRKAERERLVVATGGGRQVQAQAGPSRLAGGAQPAYGGYAASGGARPPVPSGYAPYQPNAPAAPSHPYAGGHGGYQPPNVQPTNNAYGPAPTNNTYAPPAPSNNAYAPPAPSNNAYAPQPNTNAYAPPPNNLAQPPHLRDQGVNLNRGPPPPGGLSGVPAPPPPVGMTPPPRAPPKRDPGGWNDAPATINSSSTARPSSVNVNKPSPITAPFASAPLTPGFGSPVPSPYMGGHQGGPPPHSAGMPPPRPGSVNRASVPPPPPAGRVIHQPPVGYRPPSVVQQPPPPRMISPSMHGGAPPPPHGHDQYGPPPPMRGPSVGPPPQGPYAPQAPPQGQPQYQQQHQQQHQGGPPPPPPSGPYAPPPGAGGMGGPIQPPPRPPSNASQYAPPRPSSSQQGPPGSGGPPPPGGAGGPPPRGPPPRQGPPPPKYPPGDRSHIPDEVKPAYEVIVDNLNRMKQITPPQQKRVVDDLERRLNGLFDQLNCETLSKPVVDQLIALTRAMDARDRPLALAIHVDLLTRGSQTDDIALWMSALKQLIMRL